MRIEAPVGGRAVINVLATMPVMAKEPDYLSLSKRFASLAARSSDPLLAQSYRKLAQTYRALDFWHERFRQRYEPIVDRTGDPGAERPEDDSR